ncbi:hypothetical protein TNCV_1415311 [Trichonephila clavipes]|nr:hypothetical protein TNCV_1415311 [Trichonephila clavipes]
MALSNSLPQINLGARVEPREVPTNTDIHPSQGPEILLGTLNQGQMRRFSPIKEESKREARVQSEETLQPGDIHSVAKKIYAPRRNQATITKLGKNVVW